MSWRSKFVVLLLSVMSESTALPVESDDRIEMRKLMDSDGAASYFYRVDNNGPPQIYYLSSDDLSQKFFKSSAPTVYGKPAAYINPKPTSFVYSKPIENYNKPGYIRPIESYRKPAPLLFSTLSPIYSKPLSLNYHPNSQPYSYSAPYAAAYPISYYPPKAKSSSIVPLPDFKAEIENDDTSSSSSSSSESDESDGRDDARSSHYQDDESNHSAEGGQSHEDKYHKKQGKQSNKGYKHSLKFEKGKKGSYDREDDTGKKNEEGDKKSSFYDESDKHEQYEMEDGKKKAGEYGHKKNHKKGSKSKGYHNVFMKDEYKKDHTFYGKKGY